MRRPTPSARFLGRGGSFPGDDDMPAIAASMRCRASDDYALHGPVDGLRNEPIGRILMTPGPSRLPASCWALLRSHQRQSETEPRHVAPWTMQSLRQLPGLLKPTTYLILRHCGDLVECQSASVAHGAERGKEHSVARRRGCVAELVPVQWNHRVGPGRRSEPCDAVVVSPQHT
jgi:hypothetical protein